MGKLFDEWRSRSPYYDESHEAVAQSVRRFIAAEATGWITQVGVGPTARGRDIGAHLIYEAVSRMRSAGEGTITLNVNVDNPHAAALYDRLGFTRVGRRARYRRVQSAAG